MDARKVALTWVSQLGLVLTTASAGLPAPREAHATEVTVVIGGVQPVGGCAAATIGNTLANGNASFYAILGGSADQVFVARDTLLAALTIWKPALPDTNVNNMQLFITTAEDTAMDSQVGHRPVPSDIVLVGPVFDVPYTDGIHPVPIQFRFEPPLSLPRRGWYSFAIKEALCYGVIALLADSLNSYGAGSLWKIIPFNDCALLGQTPRRIGFGNYDLVFQLEFCEQVVPAARKSWGQVKALYR